MTRKKSRHVKKIYCSRQQKNSHARSHLITFSLTEWLHHISCNRFHLRGSRLRGLPLYWGVSPWLSTNMLGTYAAFVPCIINPTHSCTKKKTPAPPPHFEACFVHSPFPPANNNDSTTIERAKWQCRNVLSDQGKTYLHLGRCHK